MSDTTAWLDRHLDDPLPRLLGAGERGSELEDLREESARVCALAERWLADPETERFGRMVFDAINDELK
ncbi:hypothetical protein PUR71_14850 [Streptomyces sp. SP17BM10]|uniref:hypothetical protein n=1 Tax=Streptomyces sp. SP17BM10 TaxID=3002530 RepID=UPI002E7886BF|nr:hypothetical protein [Streptomyces sp. SP17BM10]MEE1784166.1 hypothetical protein [Streptomyces sp. SP17BM10]